MNGIKQFLEVNRLKQKDLAEFLGISEPSVSKMVKNLTNPSKQNLCKILGNDRGWDTAPLLKGNSGSNCVEGNNNVTINTNGNHNVYSKDEELISSLRKQISLLEDQVAELKRDKEELRERVRELKNGS